MNLEEIRKKAWSISPKESPPGPCIGEYVTDDDILYFYGPDEEGEYRYRTAGDIYYMNIGKRKEKSLREELKEVINIYIDTDMKGLKGIGNYGYFLEWERPGLPIATKEGSGTVEDTTKNRLFLQATIEALDRITKAEEVHIYMPCQHVVESANKGMPEIWCVHAWIKGDKKEVKNRDLWQQLLPKIRELKPIWHDGKHAYSDVILRNIKERQNGTTGNGTHSDGSGQVWANGASPYHF